MCNMADKSTLASIRLGNEKEEISKKVNVEEELCRTKEELKEFKDRTYNEILTLHTEKNKLQKEGSWLNCMIKKLRDTFGKPSSITEGIASAINYVADKYYKKHHMTH